MQGTVVVRAFIGFGHIRKEENTTKEIKIQKYNKSRMEHNKHKNGNKQADLISSVPSVIMHQTSNYLVSMSMQLYTVQ